MSASSHEPTPSGSEKPVRSSRDPAGPMRLLVVDAKPSIRPLLEAGLLGAQAKIQYADSLVQARAKVAAGQVDLLLISSDPNQQTAIGLLADIARHRPGTRTVLVVDQPSLDLALRAMRAGVSDVIAAPVQPVELAQRLGQVMRLVRREQRSRRQRRHLRRLCRRLNQARREIAQQVEVLCGDLVNAYQDLARQMQQTLYAGEFAAAVRDELDLEQYVRRVLEYVLEKAGPTNAALYLASSGREFALGGYINYDLSGGAPDLLLQDIGDCLVEKIGSENTTATRCGREQIVAFAQREIPGLNECRILTTACRHNQEVLAVLVLFRHQSQPFSQELINTVDSLRNVLGEGLARIIRVHHRRLVDPPGEQRHPRRRAA